MTITTRSRIWDTLRCVGVIREDYLPFGSSPGGFKQIYDPQHGSGQSLIGTQTTVSEGHSWSSRSRGGFTSDIGGDFSTTRSYFEGAVTSVKARSSTIYGPSGKQKWIRTYHGPVVPIISGKPSIPTNGSKDWFPASIRSSNSAIDVLGATAVSRSKPTNSAASVSVALGELLHDGLPSLIGSHAWKDRANAAKAAGDEYLNAQFGWAPLIGDISKVASYIADSHDAVEQLRRDSGRFVRRHYQFPEERSYSETQGTSSGVMPILGSEYRANTWSSITVRVETHIQRWFSGAFKYFLPDSLKGMSGLSDLRAQADRLGLTITPDTLWNLAPWSWAVDWFSNTGDVISNITDSQKYGLIMPYGYMMEHSIVKYTYAPNNWLLNAPFGGTVPPITFVTESKVRRRANPFGFGLTDANLDSFQLSILAALGLSRSR